MSQGVGLSRWCVPSSADPNLAETVELLTNGRYVCSCAAEACEHIVAVEAGLYAAEGEPYGPQFALVPGCERQVYGSEDILGNYSQLIVPPIPPGNAHFLATVVYDLLDMGMDWYALRDYTRLLESVQGRPQTREDVERTIWDNGRLIYGPWVEGHGWDGYSVLPWAYRVLL